MFNSFLGGLIQLLIGNLSQRLMVPEADHAEVIADANAKLQAAGSADPPITDAQFKAVDTALIDYVEKRVGTKLG